MVSFTRNCPNWARFDEKWRLTTWLGFGIRVLSVTVAVRLPYVAVLISSIHNHNFSIHFLLKKESLSITDERYPDSQQWKSGFCGKCVVHHNWCRTHQGKDFDGRTWDKLREKNWKRKFRKSKKYFNSLLP